MFALLNGSRIKKKRHNNINNQLDETANGDRILTHSKNRLILLKSIIGFGIGFLGGLLGLVLGSIRMPAMIGGYLVARYTSRFSDTSLKRIIRIVLIVVAITMFLRVFQITTHIPAGL